MENKIKIFFWIAWGAIMATCAYFIILHYAWIGGDEAIVAGATGWGKQIVQYGAGMYSIGRFFPFSYTLYNILPLLFNAPISPMIIYIYHSIFLCVGVFFLSLLVLSIVKDENIFTKYGITLLIVLLFICRIYDIYYQCFTGMWIVFSIFPIFLWTMWKFIATQKWIYGIVALVLVNYVIYCYETMFVIPLSLCICALIFQRKSSSVKECIFYGLLGLSAIVFLALYVFWIVPQIVTSYDGGHGTDVGILQNAFRMLYAQKIMWVAILFVIIRAIDLIKNKKAFCLYDNLLVAACAYCCGAAVLKLNFTYYYNVGTICAIPAILYFSLHYFKPRWAILLFLLLALFYGRNIPLRVHNNQNDRKESYQTYTSLANMAQNNLFYAYLPENNDLTDFEEENRKWHMEFTKTMVGWYKKDSTFQIVPTDIFDNKRCGIWVVYEKDKKSFELMYKDSTINQVCKKGKLSFYSHKK